MEKMIYQLSLDPCRCLCHLFEMGIVNHESAELMNLESATEKKKTCSDTPVKLYAIELENE